MTLSPVIVHVPAQSITDPHLSVPQFLLLILLLFLLHSFPFAPSLPTNGPAATPFSDLEYYQSFDSTKTFSAAICNFNGSCENIFTRIDLFLSQSLPNGNNETIFLYNFYIFPCTNMFYVQETRTDSNFLMKFETTSFGSNISYLCLIARETPISASQYDTVQQTEVVDRQIRVNAKFDLPYSRTLDGRRISFPLRRNVGRQSRGNGKKILFHEETFRRCYSHPHERYPTRGWKIQPKRIRENLLRGMDVSETRIAFSKFLARTLTPETL